MKARTRNIIIATIIFSAIFGSLFIYNWNIYMETKNQFENCDDSSCLWITGNVNADKFIGISYLLNESFIRVENVEFNIVNSVGTEYNRTLSGVMLLDILKIYNLLREDAEYIRFQSMDGYTTYNFPIRLIRSNPEMVIIVTHENGQLLDSKELGGNGPLAAAVDFDCIKDDSEMQQIFEDNNQDYVHNSKFNVKYLDTLIVI
ncbi:hypothetical protein DSAG12_02461 [Promethearchaeum syntrophicum]|uniref:Oxidoreductase molybdopterin binding domain protein n=1 Tax=Promethearchaeum syntrophicum TaxID=2594042 RepID=A0A5B9DC62_9ARCH|nr:hypothetical protein [Candidatus Prometheoarchaeum syntrophicum]QEE16631.1 hypothetical protein DSAG12_02461 [Candidatus Prometheoarchaeum syntrophicum]